MLEYLKSWPARIKFWLGMKSYPFHYDKSTGEGTALESYNPFYDVVKVRYSRCGYVTNNAWMPRTMFLKKH